METGFNLCCRPCLPYVEVHLYDGCNLNCKGCSHFASLCHNEPIPDTFELLADVQRIAKLFERIEHIRLLGGEPLLNPDLIQLLNGVRKVLPHSRVSLVSNGLLLEKWGADLADALKRLNITLYVTCYPTNLDVGTRGAALMRNMGAHVIVSPMTDYFRLFLYPENSSVHGFESCEIRHCVLLRNGRIWRCSIEAMIYAYNRAFGCNYPEERGIDLECIRDGWEILEQLKQPGAMCSCCKDERRLRKWDCSDVFSAIDWRADLYKE